MRKFLLSGILSLGCIGHSFAQTEDPNSKQEKMFEHSIGVQLNPLIRQVLNFNNSTTATNANVSPYLVTYNINLKKTGWGLRIGGGYNYSSVKNDDGVTATNTKLNDVQLRVGIEKAFTLSPKWSAGAGLDFVYNSNDDNNVAVTTSFDTITTTTKTTTSSYGGGPMAWLRYNITEKILIGTETSFYYLTGKDKITVTTTITDFSGSSNSSDSKTDNKVASGTFTLPVAFYVIVKF